MANFAKLNENNVVIEINPVGNAVIDNLPFPESEAVGIEFLQPWTEEGTTWKQTSINNNFRKNYATIGGIYDPIRDAFIAPKPSDDAVFVESTCRWIMPKPYPSWTLDESIGFWVAPKPEPIGATQFWWNEELQDWVIISTE